jgi:hypothetical protein
MPYNLSVITTVAECDLILKDATEERDALALRQANIAASLKNTSENAVDYKAEFAAVSLERDALKVLVDGLPNGSDTKNRNVIRLRQLDHRHEILRQATEKSTPTARVLRELDIEQLIAEIAVIDTFIAQVRARKTELGG